VVQAVAVHYNLPIIAIGLNGLENSLTRALLSSVHVIPALLPVAVDIRHYEHSVGLGRLILSSEPRNALHAGISECVV
jgi:hypothetical protein